MKAEEPGPPGAAAWVVITGVKEALDTAKVELKKLQEEFKRQYVAITVPTAVARAVIGKSGENVKKLRTETGANIDVELGGAASETKSGKDRRGRRDSATSLATGEAMVCIRSEDPAKLEAAREAINAIVAGFTQREFFVGENIVGALMGRGGERISKLQSDTDTTVDIVRGEGGADCKLLVAGQQAGVDAAAAVIEAVIAENYTVTLTIEDAEIVGLLVGKKGEAIKKFQEENGVSMDIGKSPSASIKLKGVKDAVDAAAAKLQDTMERFKRENLTVTADPETIPALIGKGGANIRKLQEDTGVNVDVDSKSGVIKLRGPEESLKAALAIITEVCGLDKKTIEIPLDPRAVAVFVGKGGANIKRLVEEYGVTVNVNSSKNVVSIRGDPEKVAIVEPVARLQIKEAIRAEVNVAFPNDRLGALLGTKGARIKQLQADLGVTMDINRPDAKDPRRTSATLSVTIRGTEENVLRAKPFIDALAKGKAMRVLRVLPAHAAELAGRSSRNVDRIRVAEGATIVVNTTTNVVYIVAGDDSVGRVTQSVENVLVFNFGEEYQLVHVPQSLLRTLTKSSRRSNAGAGAADEEEKKAGEEEGADDEETSDAPVTAAAASTELSLASLIATSGVQAWLNEDVGYVTLVGSSGQVSAAKQVLSDAVAAAADRNAEVRVEEWMIPSVVGAKGANIQQLQKATGAELHVDRTRNAVCITGNTREAVTKATTLVKEFVDRLAAQRVVLSVSSSVIGSIIGKGGAVARALRDETGAQIDIDRESNTVTIRGSNVDGVAQCKEKIEKIIEEAGASRGGADAGGEDSANERRVKIDKSAIGALLGSGAANINRIEADSGASVRIDRTTNQVIIRGSEEAVTAAMADVKAILDEERAANPKPKASAASQETSAVPSAPVPPPFNPRAIPVGGDANMLTDQALAKMSKNARRRLRSKQDKVQEPASWSDGLDIGSADAAADDSASDLLAQLLQSSLTVSAPTASAGTSAVQAPVVKSNGVKAPPPGLSVPQAASVTVLAAAAAPAAVAEAPRRPPGIPERQTVAAVPAVVAAPAPAAPAAPVPATAYRAFTVNPFDLLGLSGPGAAARTAAPASTAASTASQGNRHVSSSYSVRL